MIVLLLIGPFCVFHLIPRKRGDFVFTQWHDIHLNFQDKQVLDGVSLTVNPGDRIGLVGANGSGKTCLLRIMLGELTPSEGDVYLARGTRIGYLTQNLLDMENDDPDRTCWDVAASPFATLVKLERKIEHYSDALASASVEPVVRHTASQIANIEPGTTTIEALLDKLGSAQERFEQAGGYTYRTRIETTLQGLGLAPPSWEQSVDTLSSGQKVRLALARLLLSEYDVLLLDEPTNHLDTNARNWLQEHLRSTELAYVVVSHDRYFLDAVVDKVAYLVRGKLSVYSGNYSAFRRQLDEQTEQAWQKYEGRQKLVRKIEVQSRKYETWSHRTEKKKIGAMDKGAVGRRAAKLMNRSLHARRRLEQTIERMQIEKPHSEAPIAIDFHASDARVLLSLHELVVGHEERQPLTEPISFTMRAGDRIAVTGPNGSGKSTLIKTVLGDVEPMSGEVSLSSAAHVGYFDQDARGIPFDTTALEAVKSAHCDETLVRTVMARMRIVQESVYKKIAQLSAGERAKVLLARLILGAHNFLILDEPTNHLDIETQDVLLEALLDFPGGILFVSHDRYFVKHLATTTLEL